MNFNEFGNKIIPGLSSFPRLIARNCIYVDKTARIYELAKDRTAKFLSRPRHFGKSTIVSTLEELFRYGTKTRDHDSFFKGLAIEKLWNDEGHYQVLRLDFKNEFADFYDSSRYFRNRLRKVLENFAASLDISISPEAHEVSETFEALLSGMQDNSLVLLIDEYDAPLRARMQLPKDSEEDEKFAGIMRGFYEVIKRHGDKFRCIFITGITRCNDSGLFTSGINIQDISLEPQYADIAGFTREELEIYYHDQLVYAASIHEGLGTDYISYNYIDDVLHQIHKWYGGYYFDKYRKTQVFSTWAVLNFFLNSEAEFKSYWYEEEAGRSGFLKKSIRALGDDFHELIHSSTLGGY